jgi:tetratricopeptide (TPR) repeat protein
MEDVNRKLVALGCAVLALTGVVLFGGVFARSSSSSSAAPAVARLAGLDALLQGFSTGNTAAYVARLERRAKAMPNDQPTLTLLGFAYQQRARETGDPTFYSLSGRALRRAVAAGPRNTLVYSGLASLDVVRHRFAAALVPAREALRLDAKNGAAWAALGDALYGSGRYHGAFHAFDQAAFLSPSVATYARVGIAREAIGRPAKAQAAIELALELDPARSIPEHNAWGLVQLGNVRFNTGNLAGAEQAYRAALHGYPRYVLARAGIARVEAARGRYAAAAHILERTLQVLPTAGNAILLTEVYSAAGKRADERRAAQLVTVIERLLRANGVRTEQQTALFDLDHGRKLADALVRARLAYREGPNVAAADVLAWALERNGRCGEALRYSRESLRLGTHDALRYFHRGMIEQCLGHAGEARAWFAKALALNPHFSLIWAPVARRLA